MNRSVNRWHIQVSRWGALRVGIPEAQLRRIADDVYELKHKHLDIDFAKTGEIKGKELFKNYVFALQKKGIVSKNLALGVDLVEYIHLKHLPSSVACVSRRASRSFRPTT